MGTPNRPINNLRTKLLVFILLLAPFLFGSGILAQNPPMVNGIVTGANGVPIPNTLVIVYAYGTDDTLGTSHTDFQGYFIIDNLPIMHEYMVWIAPTSDLVYPGQFWYMPQNTKNTPHTPVYLNDFSVFTVRITLTRTPSEFSNPLDQFIGAIQGQLYDEQNKPLRNVRVAAKHIDDSLIFEETYSMADGQFVLFHVPSERPLFLEFTPPTISGLPKQYWADYKTTLRPVHEIMVHSFDTYHRDHFIIEQHPDTGIVDTNYAVLKLRLYDEQHNILMNRCRLSIMSDWGTFEHYRDTNSFDTTMTIPQLREGNYSIFCEVEGFPPQYYNPSGNTGHNSHHFWINKGEVRHEDIHMTYGLGEGRIFGKVKNDFGATLSNVKVCALDTNHFHHGPWINTYNFQTEYMTTTNAEGFYDLQNLRPGTYIVLALPEKENYIPVFYPRTQLYQQAKQVDINPNTLEYKLEFQLRQGVSIEGHVKNKAGVALREMRINLWEDWEDSVPMRNFFYEVETNKYGKFLFHGLPSGKWHINTYDDSGLYLQIDYPYDKIITQGQNIKLDTPIVMVAGGSFYGNYIQSSNDTNNHHDLGRIFLYPTDTALINNQENDFWRHIYIGIRRTHDPKQYVTDAIPPGKWKMVTSANPGYNPNNIWQNKDFIPFTRWTFIDSAYTLMSTRPITITPRKKINRTLGFQDGGFQVKGKIVGEMGEIFGHNSATGEHGKYFHVRVFIKDAGHFVQIAESFEIGDNQFSLPGLIDGQEYYFNSYGEEYPDQWWIGNIDSASSDYTYAKPYTFSTQNFKTLRIFLQKNPHGHHPHDMPPPVENFKLKPVGLNSFCVQWDKLPPEEDIDYYLIYRLSKPRKEYFILSHGGKYWDINEKVISEDSLNKLIDTFMVVKPPLIDTTAKPHTDYMYIVAAINRKGQEGASMPGHIPLDVYFSKVNHAAFNVPARINQERWHMMGLCGLEPLPLKNAGKETQSFFWDEKADTSKLYSHYIPVETVEPGQGVWVYTYAPIDLNLSESAFNKLANNYQSIAIPLQKGWNQISSPFPYPVPLRWHGHSSVVHEFVPNIQGYRETKTLKPWRAYWVFSSVDTALALAATPSIAIKPEPTKRSASVGWEVSVSLTSKTGADPDNYIGTLPEAMSSSLSNVSFEPPRAFATSQLYFVKDQQLLSRQYHFSPAIPNRKLEWVVAISPSEEAQTIAISGLEQIPQEVNLFWIDKKGVQNLRHNSSITIEAHATTYNSLIMATDNTLDHGLYGGSFIFRQNYPNPFTRTTTLAFTIPYHWDASGKLNHEAAGLSLHIYTIAGQRVATLYSGRAKAGHYRLHWNGKNYSGRTLPSGMYIARLESAQFSKTIRMFKVK